MHTLSLSASVHYIIAIQGRDKPGITTQVADVLGQYSWIKLVDIEQSTTHRALSLSFLIQISQDHISDFEKEVTKTLNLLTQRLVLSCHIERCLTEDLISRDELSLNINRHLYAITMIADRIDATALAKLTRVLSDLEANITCIHKLSQKTIDVIEIIFSLSNHPVSILELKHRIFTLRKNLNCDIAIQKENIYRRMKRLVVFDMDSTLIQQEVIDEMARVCGFYEQVSAITDRAMNGEIDFDKALQLRLSLFKNIDAHTLVQAVTPKLKLQHGAFELIQVLKKLGYKLAVVSGGFTLFTECIQKKLGLDTAFANTLEIIDGRLTGRIVGDVINRHKKAEILQQLAQAHDISLDQVIAIGDGANDLDMLSCAGLGIAFCAKSAVQQQAEIAINRHHMASILYLLGIHEEEISLLSQNHN